MARPTVRAGALPLVRAPTRRRLLAAALQVMERDEIFEASHKIEALLQAAKLRVHVDKDTHRTPGQKMRHW
jgi:hypothetical protein